ncbi:hypothetical protein BCR33DRAFT_719039 [Rhizoclosmatium globosum]|uniref:Uncharacterized protein n=1 Tax=Rhizoclosmatium globosum TaxID=329046 RepID=A0A1Y2C1M8_9FUNG|nr:hypothetical protein BCR33DRAFT_719039 [Rhizoclosmatium globosum]|eukprot:ORY40921.1 hypothetical protein BCR33DRAFT_719039 [Rhizoclosmatium globosum]
MVKLKELVNCYPDLTGSEVHHKSPEYLALWHCNYLASKIKSVNHKPKNWNPMDNEKPIGLNFASRRKSQSTNAYRSPDAPSPQKTSAEQWQKDPDCRN